MGNCNNWKTGPGSGRAKQVYNELAQVEIQINTAKLDYRAGLITRAECLQEALPLIPRRNLLRCELPPKYWPYGTGKERG